MRAQGSGRPAVRVPLALVLVLAAAVAGCSGLAPKGPLAPPYAPPATELPAQWKPQADAGGAFGPQWQPAAPADGLPKGDWWSVFDDAQLNELESRCLAGNFSLQAALARLDLAQAQSRARSAALGPTVQAGATATRARISENRPLANYTTPNRSTVQNDVRPVLSVSWEFDWLGRLRLDAESARIGVQQSEADSESLRLLITSQVAAAYFQLRQLDEEIAVVQTSVDLQGKVLDLITRRYKEGASSEGDVAQQSALGQASRAQLALLRDQRNQQEDALATLTGTAAAQFRLLPGRLPPALPAIPLALPSTLLERRPDIASAERAMAASNAQIGVARAAYYPALTLAPTFVGTESSVLSQLFSARSAIWSLGLAATQTVFDNGRTDAAVDSAKANHAGTVANYRQTVLTAVQETQDALGSVQSLHQARQWQDEAVRSQDVAYRIGLTRYREGLDNAVTLALTEQNRLQAQRVLTQIRGSQFILGVRLIKALGGGWQGLKPPA
jgi:NodT family efflux transporter outer membrane factor (OMF) lipoprotein